MSTSASRAIRGSLEASFPECSIVGEEYGGDREAAGPQWLIDPIDGTIAYSRGIPLYATLIALLVDGEPQVGLIDLPSFAFFDVRPRSRRRLASRSE